MADKDPVRLARERKLALAELDGDDDRVKRYKAAFGKTKRAAASDDAPKSETKAAEPAKTERKG